MLASPVPLAIQETLSDFRDRLLTLFPDDIQQIILYGSYARGEATSDSDIDVMVVVRWTDPDRPDGHYLGKLVDSRWKAIVDTATDVFIEHGPPYLSLLVIGESLFETNPEVAKHARTEGQVLWKNPQT